MAMTYDSPERTVVPNHVPTTLTNSSMTTLASNMTELDVNVTQLDVTDSATGASIASPIVMFLTGLIGNVLALVVLHKTKTEIRSMMFYTLVAALTWNDLVGICLTSPPVLASYINQRQMPAADKLCRFHAFAMVCFGLSTPLIMCAMAIERSLALKCTYFYSKYCNPNSARILVGILWAFVLLFGALPLFGLGAFKLQYPKTWCFLDFRPTLPLDMAYAYTYAIINLLVVAVMILCNGLVMTTLCRVRRTRRMSNASVNSTLLNVDAVDEKASRPPQHVRRRNQRDVELQMICLLCAITTIFSVCWVPLMVYIVFSVQSPLSHSPVFGLVAVRLASLNQTLNPWIYVILRKSLLSRIRRLCQDCLPCGEDMDLPVPVPPRKPTQYPRVYIPPGQGKGRPNNYVHVRNQLCPSSQFVGQQNDGSTLSEGHQKRSKGSGSSSRSPGGGRYCSETDDEWRRGSSGMCSVCRARMMMEGHDDRSVGSLSSSSCHRGPSCSRLTYPECSAVSDVSTDHVSNSVFYPSHGNRVNLFYRAPTSDSSRSHASSQDESRTSEASRRSQAGRRGSESAANVNSYVSEADDHGYASKVSTDSSRMSTPERPHSHQRPAPDGGELSPRPVPAAPRGAMPAVSGAKRLMLEEMDCPDHSLGFASGVYDSRDEVCAEDPKDQACGPVSKGDSNSRSLSCSSAGTRTGSSSGQDRCSVINRQLSSSSGH